MKYYSQKSQFNKKRYRQLQSVVILASSIIPLVNLTSSTFSYAQHAALIASAVLGSIIAIITAFSQMDKYFETWILFRTTLEALKREKYMFLNNAGEYNNLSDSDKKRLLVERVETLLSSEHSKFFTLQQPKPEQQQQQPKS